MVPPAPGLFWITNDCPTWRPTCSNTMRAVVSLDTPGGNGITTDMLRVGQSSARATDATASAIATVRTNWRSKDVIARPPTSELGCPVSGHGLLDELRFNRGMSLIGRQRATAPCYRQNVSTAGRRPAKL